MSRFSNILSHQARWFTYERASRSKHAVAPLAGALALNHRHVGPQMLGPQGNKSRSLRSSKRDEHATNPLSLVDEDMKKIHHNALRLLREHITNEEMYNISSYYYACTEDNFLQLTGVGLLLAKAINAKSLNAGTLTNNQEKLITLIELSVVSYLLHDDIGDNAPTRFKVPSAHVLWNPYKVIMAGNAMLAITVGEAAKMSSDVAVKICLTHERQFRGTYNTIMTAVPYGDRLAHYLSVCDYKGGACGYYFAQAIAQVSGAKDLLTDIVSNLGFNIYMFSQVVDDIQDVEADLKEGLATATVIFALKEHPVLEEMIMRRFQEDGDVEKAMDLVNTCNAKEQARDLARRYYTQAMVFLKMLADSTHRDALQTILRHQFERKNFSA